MIFSSSKARALSAIVTTGNFTAASESLGISQTAVRQQIRQLEEICGAPLVERRGGQLVFSPLCLELSEIAERMVLLDQDADQAIRRSQVLSGAELRIVMGQSRPTLEVLSAFRRSFPKVRLNVQFGTYDDILRSLLNRSADLGMLACAPRDRRFRTAELSEYPIEMVCVIPKRSPLAGREEISLHELMGEDLLFQSKGSLTQKLVDAAFERCGLSPVPRVTIGTASGICEAVSHDLGIGFVWKDCIVAPTNFHVARITELSETFRETALSLSDTQNIACDAFFALVQSLNKRGPSPAPCH